MAKQDKSPFQMPLEMIQGRLDKLLEEETALERQIDNAIDTITSNQRRADEYKAAAEKLAGGPEALEEVMRPFMEGIIPPDYGNPIVFTMLTQRGHYQKLADSARTDRELNTKKHAGMAYEIAVFREAVGKFFAKKKKDVV